MIANHSQFIEALNEKKKVRVRFYSPADSGVVDRVCAPMDYGPGNAASADGLHRYWLWDCAGTAGVADRGLLPEQVVELQVLGETFDPADFGDHAWPWAIARDWGSQS
jgi:hypothetical protein